jgi:hypothetical protein
MTNTVADRPMVSVSFDVVIVAKMLRQVLKAKFPGIKFSVTTDKYSMGSSVTMRCAEMVPGAPSERTLYNIAKLFTTKTFDGMDDSTGNAPFMVDGLKVSMYGWADGSTGYRGGIEWTDSEIDAIMNMREELVRQFMSQGKQTPW